MYRIHKRIRCGKATRGGTIDARAIVCCRVTGAAIRCRRDVTRWFCDHEGRVMRLTVVATTAVFGDTRRRMVEGRHGETAVTGAVTDQTIRAVRCRH